MTSKITQTRQNISNSNLVYRKKFNFPSQQNIKIFNHPDQLEIVLLNQLQTKNNQNYQYLLILLEKGNPKYTVYAEVNQTKQLTIYGYDEIGEQPRNTQTKEHISESEFTELAEQFINQYIQEEIQKKVEAEKRRLEAEIIKKIELALEKSGRDQNQVQEFRKLQNLISEQLKVKLWKIGLDSHIINNLGLKSENNLSNTSLAKSLTKQFQVEIQDNMLSATVGELFDLILIKKMVVKILSKQLQVGLDKINLVYCKKLDLPFNQKIAFTHPDELQIVLLSQVKTKNNQEYPYLMLLLENLVPKSYVYSEEIEVEKEYGKNIGGLPVGYRKEKIKSYRIRRYNEIGKPLINSKTIENLEKEKFTEVALELINQYIEVKEKRHIAEVERRITKEKRRRAKEARGRDEEEKCKILARVKKLVTKQLKMEIEKIEPESSLSNKLGLNKLDIWELQWALEKEFALKIADEEMNRISTVRELLEFIYMKIKSKRK